MFRRIFPRIWPFVFLTGGIVSVVSGNAESANMVMGANMPALPACTHSICLFSVFGAQVGLHDLMWFLMALAHTEAFFRKQGSRN